MASPDISSRCSAGGQKTSPAYAITAGNTGTTFAINSGSGQLAVADPTLLDYEATPPPPSFALTVRVTDPVGLFDEETVTVNLNDVVEGIISLSATLKGKMNRKGQKVQLQWSGTADANVDIRRYGGLGDYDVTIANDGSYNDTVTDSGTYTYEVCDTSTCSNTTDPVTF